MSFAVISDYGQVKAGIAAVNMLVTKALFFPKIKSQPGPEPPAHAAVGRWLLWPPGWTPGFGSVHLDLESGHHDPRSGSSALRLHLRHSCRDEGRLIRLRQGLRLGKLSCNLSEVSGPTILKPCKGIKLHRSELPRMPGGGEDPRGACYPEEKGQVALPRGLPPAERSQQRRPRCQ